jgi:Ca2+/Na+ antiporter
MDQVGFSMVFSLVMLALGTWCIHDGAEILTRHHDSSVFWGFVISFINTFPALFLVWAALSRGRTSLAISALSGSVAGMCMSNTR